MFTCKTGILRSAFVTDRPYVLRQNGQSCAGSPPSAVLTDRAARCLAATMKMAATRRRTNAKIKAMIASRRAKRDTMSYSSPDARSATPTDFRPFAHPSNRSVLFSSLSLYRCATKTPHGVVPGLALTVT
jgi:hypothetical protein